MMSAARWLFEGWVKATLLDDVQMHKTDAFINV